MIRRILGKAVLAGALGFSMLAQAAGPVIQVYKSATCGCCGHWVEHLKGQGFSVKATDVPSPAEYREKAGIPAQYGSCHTAMVGGYAIEGHVPAREIKRLLKERPKAVGLAVPAMPMGSPGMEGPRKDPYDVLLIQADGKTSVYQHYK
ncbi:DUF411 domain-containing protein [Pseudoduganella namucuonensis]|uniref:Uncharacterized conserved protein n=1 Tax=Pseudoduganella namucuonensis TaxID=1035707 RepID=A0A1I7LHZ5_9BURK|nr:DUF411 domain-containing protein [Pseudoduganella namucuonensis]SFV09296.1 Uncharacterized conserved protein [Pseudoduganella namucuonensis]